MRNLPGYGIWFFVFALAVSGLAACRTDRPATGIVSPWLTGFHIDMNIAQFRGP